MAPEEANIFAEEDDDIVHASWRHEENHEQGIRRRTCGWNISLPGRNSLKRIEYFLFIREATDML